MPPTAIGYRLRRALGVALLPLLLAPTVGCFSSLHHRASHLCRCQCFHCDDYCTKCTPDVCTPQRCQACDNYCRKCQPPGCVPCRKQTCDDYCPKPCPDVCWCPPIDHQRCR